MKETKFKNTEIGRIPEEWETCTILSQKQQTCCRICRNLRKVLYEQGRRCYDAQNW